MAKSVPLVDSITGQFSGKVLAGLNTSMGEQIATPDSPANLSAEAIAKRQAIIFAIALGG